MKFKVGDVVRIVKPFYQNKEVTGAIARIKRYRGINHFVPYEVEFLSEPHKHDTFIADIFKAEEMKKLNDKEALAWLI
jgi:hypothetical protein